MQHALRKTYIPIIHGHPTTLELYLLSTLIHCRCDKNGDGKLSEEEVKEVRFEKHEKQSINNLCFMHKVVRMFFAYN